MCGRPWSSFGRAMMSGRAGSSGGTGGYFAVSSAIMLSSVGEMFCCLLGSTPVRRVPDSVRDEEIDSVEISPNHRSRVPHIWLVFREMWDTTALTQKLKRKPLPADGHRTGSQTQNEPSSSTGKWLAL